MASQRFPTSGTGCMLDIFGFAELRRLLTALRQAELNIISANLTNGVYILGTANQNYIYANNIGVNRTGNGPLGNGEDGVLIEDSGSNDVGDPGGEGANVISANGDDGIEIRGSNSIGNIVMDNLIGVDATGNVAMGNGDDGVAVFDEPTQTQIGDSIHPNTISETAGAAYPSFNRRSATWSGAITSA